MALGRAATHVRARIGNWEDLGGEVTHHHGVRGAKGGSEFRPVKPFRPERGDLTRQTCMQRMSPTPGLRTYAYRARRHGRGAWRGGSSGLC